LQLKGEHSKHYWQWKHVYKYWAKDHGWRIGIDLQLVSTQTIAFHHLTTPKLMKRHHAIIYNSCPVGTVLEEILTKNQATNTELNSA
jgi:hypothetical protein